MPIQLGKNLPSLKLKYLLEVIKRRKDPAAKLLEIGCGSGRILASIRERDKKINLTGIDLSAEQIRLAKQVNKGREITFVQGDGQKLPFKANSFDYVIFFDFLEHIDHPKQALSEIQRVLKKGGHLHFVCPAERQSVYWASMKLFGRHFKEQTGGHVQQYTRKQLAEMVKNAKMKVVEQHYSYHTLGSLMDYGLFTTMLHPKVAQQYWTANNFYAKNEKAKKKTIFNRLLTLGNGIAWAESSVFRKVPLTACAVHLTARK